MMNGLIDRIQLESEIEDRFCRELEQLGGSTRKVKWLGRNGAPDRLAFGPGLRPCFVEFKRPRGGRLSPQQVSEHADMAAGGLRVFVAWTHREADGVLRWMRG